MIRIMISWTFVSPALGVASGVVSIDDIEFKLIDREDHIVNLLQCKIKVEEGSLSFSSIDEKGVPSKTFERFREYIAQMAYSYRRGMTLQDYDFYWIPDEEQYMEKKEKGKGFTQRVYYKGA